MGRFFSSNRNVRIAVAAVFVVWVMCLGVMVVAGLVYTRTNLRAKGVATEVANPVTEANIQVSPASGYAGTPLTITGSHWQPGEVVFIRLSATGNLGADNENYAYAGAVADDKGQFSSTFTYPYESKWLENDGIQIVARAEASGVQATVPFRLEQPTVIPTPTELVTATPTDTPIPPEELTPPAPGMPTRTPRPQPTLPPPPVEPTITDWRGAYYNNPNLQGQPVMIRNDQQIDFDWQMESPAPEVNRDNFSVLWTRNQNFDGGNYRFTLQVDDGARFYLDNQPVIDQWHDGPTQFVVELYVTPGTHSLRMDYFEHIGWALARLSWQRIDASYPEWKAEYFSNPDLSGSPVLVRNDAWVDFNWGNGVPGPGVPADNFSVRWTRRLHFDDGNYRFSAKVDDGARLWVDGQLLIDQWHDSGATTYVSDRSLSSGDHDVRLEYYDRAGGAEAHLFWARTESASYPDWKGEYFSNRKLEGSPAMTRNDKDIDFGWGTSGPGSGIPGDSFSARWTRRVHFDSTAQYKFTGRMDDGMRLWVDDDRILNDWNDGSLREVSATAKVSKGDHDVRVEYYNRAATAEIQVSWAKVAATATPKPTNTLVVQPTETATANPIPTQQAQPGISLSPAEGAISSSIAVKGTNWPAGQAVTLALAQPQPNAKLLQINPNAAVGNVAVSSTGEFKTSIAIPAGLGWEERSEALVVAYTADLSKTAVASFAITGGQPQPQPTEVQPQPTTAEPQPTEAQPQPTEVKPQPTEPQPQPTEVQPQPTVVEPQPTVVEPQPTVVEPQPTEVQPQPTETQQTGPAEPPTVEATATKPESKPTKAAEATDTPTVAPEATDTPAAVTAEPMISLSPISGTVGITLTVVGQDWPAGDEIEFGLAQPAAQPKDLVSVPVTGTATVSEKGQFRSQFLLPVGAGWEAVPQVIVIAKTADGKYEAVAPFTVIVPASETPASEPSDQPAGSGRPHRKN